MKNYIFIRPTYLNRMYKLVCEKIRLKINVLMLKVITFTDRVCSSADFCNICNQLFQKLGCDLFELAVTQKAKKWVVCLSARMMLPL